MITKSGEKEKHYLPLRLEREVRVPILAWKISSRPLGMLAGIDEVVNHPPAIQLQHNGRHLDKLRLGPDKNVNHRRTWSFTGRPLRPRFL